jgi:putative ABC transport system permease protein
VVVRTAGDPMLTAPVLTSLVRQLDRDVPVYGVKTMDQQLAGATSRTRFSAVLLSVFAALALLLSGIGLYGVVASSVAARTREIGIRMALGANRADVLRLVVGDGLLLCGIGLLAGLPASFAATRVLSSFLYGTQSGDPLAVVTVASLLSAVAILASYIPARRAMRIDPLVALRYE